MKEKILPSAHWQLNFKICVIDLVHNKYYSYIDKSRNNFVVFLVLASFILNTLGYLLFLFVLFNFAKAEKYVYLEDVEHWCAAGWKKGRLKRERSHTHDRKGEPIAC